MRGGEGGAVGDGIGAVVLNFFSANDERRQHHQVQLLGARLAVEFGCAGLVGYTIGGISGGPGDKWAVVRMVGAWYG